MKHLRLKISDIKVAVTHDGKHSMIYRSKVSQCGLDQRWRCKISRVLWAKIFYKYQDEQSPQQSKKKYIFTGL